MRHQSVLEWGRDVAFLSEPGGIYKLNEVIQDQVAAEPLPVSERIQSVIDRIKWPTAEVGLRRALGESVILPCHWTRRAVVITQCWC
jgi:hypothetical protein